MTAAAGADALLTPDAVRARCTELLGLALDGALPWFSVDLARLDAAAERVVDEIRRNYPGLNVPFHSRWRHFEFDGADLWAELCRTGGLAGTERAAAAGDLAVVSVLLDAGAGPDWRYRDDRTGIESGRSEGLALASLRLFESGGFSAVPGTPGRVDADALRGVDAARLAAAFQADDENPLVGIEGRAGLLRRLGEAIAAQPEIFARDGSVRPGNLVAWLARNGTVDARDILVAVLGTLNGIWPSPIKLAGRPLGDVGRHRAILRDDGTAGLVPFHKLSQWLSYSLIEPLQWQGAAVTGLDGLTGLAEYRNGGLFLDTGVIVLKDPAQAHRAHRPSDELIVEWRALTVALLDRVAATVRDRLGRDLPLASILQGGTWSAGRRIAGELRPGGTPPLDIVSDATIF